MNQNARMLKAVVIGLGLLILLSIGLIAYKVVAGLGGSAVEPPSRYTDAAVALPPGARVITMTGDGDALSLLVEDREGRQRIITIDRRSGEALGTLTLEPGS